MNSEDLKLFLELVNTASFKGETAEYVVDLKKRIADEINKKGSE